MLSLIYPVRLDFDKPIMKYPNITRFVCGASNDLVPNLQHPEHPVPLLKSSSRRFRLAAGTADRVRQCEVRSQTRIPMDRGFDCLCLLTPFAIGECHEGI